MVVDDDDPTVVARWRVVKVDDENDDSLGRPNADRLAIPLAVETTTRRLDRILADGAKANADDKTRAHAAG